MIEPRDITYAMVTLVVIGVLIGAAIVGLVVWLT